MDPGVGQAFEAQPDLVCMIEIAQQARQADLVRALHEQCRVLLCTPAGIAPGDQEWHGTPKRSAAKIGTIKMEAQILPLCLLVLMAINLKCMKGGMLMLNYIGLVALKQHRMPTARTVAFGVVTEVQPWYGY